MTTKSIAAVQSLNLASLALSAMRFGAAVMAWAIVGFTIGALLVAAGIVGVLGAAAWWLFTLPGRVLGA